MLLDNFAIDLSTAEAQAPELMAIQLDPADRRLIPGVLSTTRQLGRLTLRQDIHFYSNGAFNLVQLVLYILRQTGPANLFLSSYSIAEESLAILRKRVDNGDILTCRFLIDNRVRTISPKPFAYLASAFGDDYRCCSLHAKVALIWNEDWHVTVVGSQNATNNPKLERGIIHTNRQLFDFDLKVLSDVFQQGTT